VCKHFLVKFCPNSLFINTKADIGPCSLVHDDYLKREYQSNASKQEKRQYEDDFIRFCQAQLNDVEKKIKRAKQRLEMSQIEKMNLAGNYTLNEEHQERIREITEKIEKLLEEIQNLGCEGKVEEAQILMKEVDQLKEERAHIKRDNQSGHWIQKKAEIGVAQEKQMEVCDVCGAFLIVNDVQQRVDDHLMGKQHVGYGKLKNALDEIMQKRRRHEEEKDESRSSSRSLHDNRDNHHRNRDRRLDNTSSRRSRDDHHRSLHHSSHNRNKSRSRSPDKYGQQHHHHHHRSSRNSFNRQSSNNGTNNNYH
ncbi:luc7-like protein, partial [Euroglyphus maynei]